jgi:hypothetical protein
MKHRNGTCRVGNFDISRLPVEILQHKKSLRVRIDYRCASVPIITYEDAF